MTSSGKQRLLIVGGLSIDTITTAQGESHLAIPGGNAIFAAIGAEVWGVRPAVIGLIGEDYPQAWLDDLGRAGVDVSGVQHAAGPHQNHFAVRYRDDRDREPYVPVEAFDRAGIGLPPILQGMADLLSTEGNAWRANDEMRTVGWKAHPEAVPLATREADGCLIVPAALARQQSWIEATQAWLPAGASLFLDPEEEQGRVLSLTDLRSVMHGVDVVMPSLRQVSALLTDRDVLGTARTLTSLGPRVAAIKLGADGCIVYDATTLWHSQIPAFATDVRDPTGAGDAFCGGFAAGYLQTHDPFEAGLYGAVSASFAIEGFGAFAGLAHGASEAARRLTVLRELVIEHELEGLTG